MNNKEQLKKVKDLLKREKAQAAKQLFLQIKEHETVEYFLVKAEIEQKFQNWGEAINALNRILTLEPENKEATDNLRLIQNILGFWNPDLLNP